MISQIPLVFIVFAATLLTSSAYKLSPPSNYTWPRNTANLCFAAELDLRLNVQYLQVDGSNNNVTIAVDNSTYESYRVSCAEINNVHELTISLLSGLTNIILQFTVNATNATSLTKVYGYVSINDKQTRFPRHADATVGVHPFSSNESLFENERASSYRCETKTVVTGFNKTGNVVITSIELENLRVRPFADDSAPFDNHVVEKVCKADDEKDSNLVPIIVGACLAVLVIIVLIAYLIGRRRSRTGYQSV